MIRAANCKDSARRLALCAPLLFFGCGIAAILAHGMAQARSLAEIERSKEMRICIAPVHPAVAQAEPTDCQEDCTFSGSAFEIALAFVSALSKPVSAKFVRVGWDQQFHNDEGQTVHEASYTPALLASGICDLYPANLTKTAWRQKKLDFVTLTPSRMMVIVHQSNKAQFTGPADLAGKTATMLKDTSYHSWLEQRNKDDFHDQPIKIKLVGGQERVMAVDAGDADFTILDSNLALWSTRHQAKNTVVAFAVGPIEEIGWACRKEDKDLQTAVQTFFAAQRADRHSAVNRIWKKTYGLSLTKFIALVTAIK